MDESVDVSFISFLLESEFNASNICIQFEIPTQNAVFKILTKDGVSSNLANSKIPKPSKAVSTKTPLKRKGRVKVSTLNKRVSNSLATKYTECKATKLSVCGNKKVTKSKGTKVKNLTIKKSVAIQEKKTDANKARKPAANKTKTTRLYAKEGTLKKSWGKKLPVFGNFFKQENIDIKEEISTHNPVWSLVGTADGLTDRLFNVKISTEALSGYKIIKENPKLDNLAFNTLATNHTIGKTTASTDSGVINIEKISTNLVKPAVIKISFSRKEDKQDTNEVTKQAANLAKKSTRNKIKRPATKKVKKPSIATKTGVLKKPWRKTIPFFGDFSNREIKCMESESPTYHPFQTNITQDRLISRRYNSQTEVSSMAESSQKHLEYERNRDASSLGKKTSNYFGTKTNRGKNINYSTIAYKRIANINKKRVKSLVLKELFASKEKKQAANRDIKQAANTTRELKVTPKESNQNESESDTIYFIGDILFKCIAVIFTIILVKTVLSVYIPKQARY